MAIVLELLIDFKINELWKNRWEMMVGIKEKKNANFLTCDAILRIFNSLMKVWFETL